MANPSSGMNRRNVLRMMAGTAALTPLLADQNSGGRPILSMTDNQALDRSFFLVVRTESHFEFPSDMQAHLTKFFAGQAITVYRFDL